MERSKDEGPAPASRGVPTGTYPHLSGVLAEITARTMTETRDWPKQWGDPRAREARVPEKLPRDGKRERNREFLRVRRGFYTVFFMQIAGRH